jgi:DNA/RNA endonuclease YhcR with UshA esterase domain
MPCITEINAGRFGMSTNIFDLPGKHNMASTYVQLALDEPVEISDRYDITEDYYMVRDVDTTPSLYSSDELFEGIEDARR